MPLFPALWSRYLLDLWPSAAPEPVPTTRMALQTDTLFMFRRVLPVSHSLRYSVKASSSYGENLTFLSSIGQYPTLTGYIWSQRQISWFVFRPRLTWRRHCANSNSDLTRASVPALFSVHEGPVPCAECILRHGILIRRRSAFAQLRARTQWHRMPRPPRAGIRHSELGHLFGD